MRKSIGIVSFAFLFMLMFFGCASISPGAPKYFPKPTFEQSHSILIDRTVNGLPIVDSVKNHIRKNEKLTVLSIERFISDDSPINYLIDDNLISLLTIEGYRVLERDDNMMVWIIPEQSGTYKSGLHRILPTPPILTMTDVLGTMTDNDSEDTAKTSQDIVNLYRQLKEDYIALEAQQVRLDSADVILSYRLLECGIVCDIEKTKQKYMDPITGKEDSLSPELWVYNIKRNAMARLFIRLTDAKTGEIRNADILQNDLTDSVILKQDKDEKESEFFARVDEYLSLLAKYHYTYYDQQLPNQITKSNEKKSTTPITSSAAETQTFSSGNPDNNNLKINSGNISKTQDNFPMISVNVSIASYIAGSPYGSVYADEDDMISPIAGATLSSRLFNQFGIIAGVDTVADNGNLFVSGGLTYDIGPLYRIGARAGQSLYSFDKIFSIPFLMNLKFFILGIDTGITVGEYSSDVFLGVSFGFGLF